MLVEDEKMMDVLRHMRVQAPWQKIKETYENWENTFKQDHFKFLMLNDFQILSEVFYFKSDALDKCRGELIYFLRNHQEFYNDNIEVVYTRMQERKELHNTELAQMGKSPIPFINWFPQYGGKIAHAKSRRNAEYDWHKRNQIEFALDHYVIPLDEERPKRRRRRVSDDSE